MSFLGTDLNSAYGGGLTGFSDDIMNNSSGKNTSPRRGEMDYDSQAAAASRYQSPPSSPKQQQVLQQGLLQSQQQQQIPLVPSQPQSVFDQLQYENEMTHLQKELYKYQRQNMPSQPSFFDAMWAKRRELVKLLMFSLVIIIALSFHSVMEHVIKTYISENDMTPRNEVLLRFAYPVAMILIVWFMKVGTSSKVDY